jgi:hypothetical protein
MICPEDYLADITIRLNESQPISILDEWGVTMTSKSKIRVLAGQWVSEGSAASQVGLITGEVRGGGNYQALFSLPNIPDSWIVTTGRAFP